MNISGEYVFRAPPQFVWDALQDPKVLAAVLPGCERLDEVSPHNFEGAIKLKVGPVQGEYAGKVTLGDLKPPESFTMKVEGTGQQGYVNATAAIALAPESQGTKVTYASEAQVGGRIATLGGRLIETSARSIVRQSLEGLDACITAQLAAAAVVARAGGSTSEAKAAAASAVMPTTSQADVAARVAKDVASDLVSPGVRRAILFAIILAIVLFVALQLSR